MPKIRRMRRVVGRWLRNKQLPAALPETKEQLEKRLPAGTPERPMSGIPHAGESAQGSRMSRGRRRMPELLGVPSSGSLRCQVAGRKSRVLSSSRRLLVRRRRIITQMVVVE